MKQPLKLPYGKKRLSLECQPENLLEVLREKEFLSTRSEADLIEEGLQNLPGYIQPKSKILIIASDITRKVGTERFLPVLIERLQRLSGNSVKILFSTGLHRLQAESEQSFLLGKYFGKVDAVDHDCHGKSVDYGTTSSGTTILLNPLVGWADAIILTGGINFHYFAGFTGGRKALLPGIAARESILQNHKLVFSLVSRGFHPQVKPGQLAGNPVAEDLQETAAMVSKKKKFYLFNTILNSRGTICCVVSGDYKTEFQKGCGILRKQNSVLIKKKACLVIASAGGFPYDTNLIQSHKALYQAYQALEEGGTLVLLAECAEGITGQGEEADKKFLRYFDLTLGQMDELFRQEFDLNCNTAYSIAEKAKLANVILVSQLKAESVRRLGMHPAQNIEEAVQLALKMIAKRRPDTYVIDNAATLLPVLSGLSF